jgi:hypothetical protein
MYSGLNAYLKIQCQTTWDGWFDMWSIQTSGIKICVKSNLYPNLCNPVHQCAYFPGEKTCAVTVYCVYMLQHGRMEGVMVTRGSKCPYSYYVLWAHLTPREYNLD